MQIVRVLCNADPAKAIKENYCAYKVHERSIRNANAQCAVYSNLAIVLQLY